MIIEITVDAAADPEVHEWLDRILAKVKDGWHVWAVSGLESYATTSWVKDRGTKGAWVTELFMASIRRNAWESGLNQRRLRVSCTPVAEHELSPEAACRLVEEPLRILVENRNSDGAFIRRVIQEMDHSFDKLWHQPGEPIRIDSVGGKGEMRKEVLKPNNQRLAVVVDSDRRGPADPPSTEASRLDHTCQKHGVACWVLTKREAENYLPRVLLEAREDAGSDHHKRLGAWDRLSDDQKDFYDMKNGLSDSPKASQRELFESLSDADRKTLHPGFGDNVGSCWEVRRVHQIAADLRSRGRGDLERGIQLLRSQV